MKLREEKWKNWSERIYSLPALQLEHKLKELEQQNDLVMNGFVSAGVSHQREALVRVSNIKEKIKIIKEVIESRGISSERDLQIDDYYSRISKEA